MELNHLLLLVYSGMIFLAFLGSRFDFYRSMGILFAIMCITGSLLMILVSDNGNYMETILCAWLPGILLDIGLFFSWIKEHSARQVLSIRERVTSMLTREQEALRQRGEELVAQTEPMLVVSELIELIFICTNDYSLYEFGDELAHSWELRSKQSDELKQITHRLNVINLRLQAIEDCSDLARLKDLEAAITAELSDTM